MYKNLASQKAAVFARYIDGTAKTGDASNITAQISKDGGACAATNDTNPTELDSTDAPGIYLFDMTQAETNANLVIIAAASSTDGVEIDPVIIYTKSTGPGALEITYTVKEDDEDTGDPLEGVEVWISTDASGANIIWNGTTDASGILKEAGGSKPYLDAGTYYFWRKKSGYNFTNPDSETFA